MGVDACPDVAGKFALQQLGDGACILNHFERTGDFTQSIVMCLAMLATNLACNVVRLFAHQCCIGEHHAGTFGRRQGRPCGQSRLGGGHRFIDLGFARKPDRTDLLSGRGVEDCAFSARGRGNHVPVDEILDLIHGLVELLEDRRQSVEDLINLFFFDNERRRQGDDVARRANEDTLLECLEEAVKGAFSRLARDRLQLDGPDEADVADINHMRQTLETVQGILPIAGKIGSALEEAFFGIRYSRVAMPAAEAIGLPE